MPPLSIGVYKNLQELEPLRPAWDDLLASFPGATTFSTWEWLAPWWRAFGEGRELLALAFFDGETLVGLAPLQISQRRVASFLHLRILGLMGDGSGDSDNLDIPVRVGWEAPVAAALLEFLKRESKQWDFCEFNTMPADSPVANSLAKLLENQGWKAYRRWQACSAISLPESWEAYLDQLSSKERGKIAYYRKRLDRKARVRFYRCESEHELSAYLEKLFLLHRKRWQSLKQKGSFESAARRQFYYELARLLIARRNLEFWLLDVDGNTVAAQFGFVHSRNVFQLQEGFDPAYFSDSVGYVLRAHVIERLISQGVRRYDFLAGESASKTRWATKLGHYITLQFARPLTLGRACLCTIRSAAKSKEWLRTQLPNKLWRWLHNVNVRIRGRKTPMITPSLRNATRPQSQAVTPTRKDLTYCEYRFLRWAYSSDPDHLNGSAYQNRSKLETLFGPELFYKIRNKTVIDFGCGHGDQTIELAKRGAKFVIGVDIREEMLEEARAKSGELGNLQFLGPAQCPRGIADFVISLDSFEHFENPSAMLELINELLQPGGELLSCFGPPWKHPYGGHAFSAFPWSHLLFRERALVDWYNNVKHEAISRYEEVSGGLNRMTVAQFERLVRASKFREASITPVPIRKLKLFHNPFTREFTTAVVKCQLTK
jgi:CelD/BcsL family acetyltransferase involved in cellulose biosynthesis/2-polyprenyl-3-methyl-5-hydroxy-6-metoxy-1,4-benzoquinol methylase